MNISSYNITDVGYHYIGIRVLVVSQFWNSSYSKAT